MLYAATNKYKHKRNADVNVGTVKEAVILYNDACKKTVNHNPNSDINKTFSRKNTT